jgi:hypothetical protein
MDSQVKTSFIPKRPINMGTSDKVSIPIKRSGAGRTILSLIALVLFFGSLAGLGGVFFFKFSLENKIKNQVASLEEARNEFDEAFISEATRLNRRIDASKELLNNHLSPSSLYALLEEYTLQSVSFSDFTFSDDRAGNITVQGKGDAARFESIVLQSDSLGRSGFMRNVLFSGLEPDTEENTINFTFESTLDPRLVLYKNSLPETFE